MFLVHAGFLKTCELAHDGREQVTAFRMRGDLIGVESIGLGSYSCDVVALEDSELWELPYPPVLLACRELPELQIRLAAALAEEIRRDRSWMLALGTLSAERRVAAFLLDVAQRHAALGFSPRHFILRMGRADMGSFLALEARDGDAGPVAPGRLATSTVQRREVRVLDVDRAGADGRAGRTGALSGAPRPARRLRSRRAVPSVVQRAVRSQRQIVAAIRLAQQRQVGASGLTPSGARS